jgi:cellobiose-specific phosphotransferase system component IIA
MNRDARDLHLPNAKNCIQSALYQIERGNSAVAVEFLKSAKRSLDKAHPSPKKIRRSTEGNSQ